MGLEKTPWPLKKPYLKRRLKWSHHECQPLDDHSTSSKPSLHISVQSPSTYFLQGLIAHLLTTSFRNSRIKFYFVLSLWLSFIQLSASWTQIFIIPLNLLHWLFLHPAFKSPILKKKINKFSYDPAVFSDYGMILFSYLISTNMYSMDSWLSYFIILSCHDYYCLVSVSCSVN